MTETIDICNKTIYSLGINNIEVVTVAKVGTKVFADGGLKTFYHSIEALIDIVNNYENTLIISGIRNPLDRNISFMFEYFHRNDCDVIFKDGTNIKDTFICDVEDLPFMDTDKLIEMYKNKTYHHEVNRWFTEFFEITGVHTVPFNKELGVQLYKLPERNNYILFYVLEKLDTNRELFSHFLGIQITDCRYSIEDRGWDVRDKYRDFKNKLVLDENYKKPLLDTDIMRTFYSEEEIARFYEMYSEKL